ncbi:MAG: lysine exporter LysO family protein [Paramuribaculum sp.]|nr:lysine exporter LysO family protein [Paramuribaculum sp.]MDE7471420.1 lysine exporter LysO family protein [Paramuribaculum sp.]
MVKILLILAGGFAVGMIAARLSHGRVPDTGRLVTVVVLAMLVAFGGGIGGNSEIIASLPTLGLRGAILGFAAMAGSATLCMCLQGRKRGGIRANKQSSGQLLRMMSGSAMTIAAFGAGVAAGWLHLIPGEVHCESIAEWLLYVLVALVGLGLGSAPHGRLKPAGGEMRMLAVAPVSVAGTALGGLLVGLLPGGYDIGDSVTAVSGMGYYSLSSMLIVKLKAGAMQLGAVALLGNIVRELLTLMLAPVIGRWMGSYALVGAAGVTSLDVLLPSIRNCCGDGAVTVALVNGIMLEVSCPLLITAACAYL